MEKKNEKILLSGDWSEGLDEISSALKHVGYEIITCPLLELKPHVKKKGNDLILLAMQGDSPETTQRLSEVRRANEKIPLFLYAKNHSVDFVVRSLKRGVTDFFTRPLEKETLLEKISKEIHLYVLTNKIFMIDSTPIETHRFEGMIGRNKRMQENFQIISAVAKSNATVLVTGESGTGKELVAKAIHKLSERSSHRLIDINCGAIPRDLLENELFGHEKGSFTGAHKRYQGSFEAAHKGSLFLDEISEMDVLLQVKLLRVLQERCFTRIGGNEKISVDVRIIAATNQNLPKLIERNGFREDLYYRLNVVNIQIPALRERREDVPLLAKHFLDYYSAKNNRIFLDFATDAMEALINYDWPGNVRELENTIERIVVLHNTSQVKLKQLPLHIQKVDRSIGYAEQEEKSTEENLIVPLEELERRAIEAALLKFQGNISVVAKKLKVGQATLYRKVKKFGLSQ